MNLTDCTLCPRLCHVDRRERTGFCGAGERAKIALVSLHPWEEPCLTGEKGAGTVFFSYCNLRCCYCQNYEISHEGKGMEVSDERLAEIFLEQQERGAATLDLVTPTHYVPQILHGLDMARERGFSLPVVYNSSGYETLGTIDALRGYVDIFLPDLKYRHEKSAREYSQAPDYFLVASEAIRRMVRQTGPAVMDGEGRMRRGVLVRHLVLPGCRHESMELLDWLWQEFGNDIHISLMSQYTPMHHGKEHGNLGRRLTTFEYESVVEHALALGITQCYVQERRAASREYVPEFDGSGVIR
ncbi:MAG: 4Fe-4S cluster-binding domain-containing protein [Selenomonadaceae bacterium]|nr:4Fe-4S cluster-binding domain-containing protein [Selenomonadaceae bacterium]MBQ3970908.1 4Fe-4S cluster-binding domain-containing protein [Selenomonadaceae bacterium]